MGSSETSFHIEGMHCGGCVSRVDKALRSVAGVTDAAVNLATNTARVTGDADPAALLAAVAKAGYKARVLADMSAKTVREISAHGEAEAQSQRGRLFWGVLLGVPAVALEMMLHHPEWLGFTLTGEVAAGLMVLAAVLATTVMVLTGLPYFVRGLKSAFRAAPNMDTLIALGAGTAYVASAISLGWWWNGGGHAGHGGGPVIAEFHAAVTIVVLITLGKFLEAAKKRASSAVASLSAQASATAMRIKADGTLETIPAEQVMVGDRLQILAHQQLPVDGQVVEGSGAVDLSIITGESVPVEIAASPRRRVAASSMSLPIADARSTPPLDGPILPGGATLADGRIVLAATSTAATSTVARILELVNAAQASKTQIQSLADRVAAIFVPIILGLGVCNFGLWYLLGYGWETALLRTIATIVIACPCAMGLATPTALTVAMGRAARMGILFTKAAALETARQITTVLFDKTGTLTTGTLEVVKIEGAGETLQIAASIEQFSEHPLAKAIVARAVADGIALHRPGDFHSAPGGGVTGMVQRRRYAAGSAAFVSSIGASVAPGADDQGASTIYLADSDEKKIVGTVWLRDTLRPEAGEMLQVLRERGYQVGVLTGDTESAAKAALENLPLDFIRANVRPEGKAAAIAELKLENGGQDSPRRVAFVGDGINDGPALAAADLGIAVATSTHIARAAGDVLLMSNKLTTIPEVLRLSRHTLRVIKQNLFWAFAYNVAAIPLAMLGVLSPGMAAAAMMLSSLTVVANALRLYRVPL